MLDGTTGNTLATANVGLGPSALVVDPMTGTAYVGNAQDGSVSAITPCPETDGSLNSRVYLPAVFK